MHKLMPWLKPGVFLLVLVPLGKLLFAAWQDDLGANPIEKITHTTGYWALSFLLITLSATPLRRLTHWNWPMRVRRMLGLFAFFYATLHFLSYLILDQFFDWPAIVEDIAKRPYITVGFSAFVLLIPLAITSNNYLMRKMGGKLWQRLHTLVYLISVAGVVHFLWLVKKDIRTPSIFAGILALLFLIRWYYRKQRRIKSQA